MTENTTRTDETRTATASKMKAVDHTHPDTDRPFGEAVVYQRGPTVAADGGERGAANEADTVESETDEATEEQMKDVDHEPPNEAEANRVFERGSEGRDDTR